MENSNKSGLARFMPALGWLPTYQKSYLVADLIAGLTLAAYMVPAAIGDASLANLPPEAGLYACLFPGLIFWLFCSSRHTTISVTSAISLLIGSSLGAMAGGNNERFYALATTTALLVGIIGVVAWAVRGGAVVHFVSETVMLGFKCGVALFLASTQLPKLFGVHGSHGDFWERSATFLGELGHTNPASLAVGAVALAILVLGKMYAKDKPVALFVVVGGIVASSVARLGERGVKLLGDVPEGLPMPGLPMISLADLQELMPLALACFMLGAVETAAIGRMFAAKHRGRFDCNQEFLAIGAVNLATGLTRGFPVSGGMSQSLVNESSGARTPLSGLFASLVVLIVTVFLASLLHNLPQPVLAAVVLVAILGLINVPALKRLYALARTEFFIAIAATAGVLSSGMLRGVMIGAVMSLLLLIRRASSPYVAFLGRIPGTQRFSDMARHPDNEPVEGILIFRAESSLLYFNAEHVRDVVLEEFHRTHPRLVLCDLSSSPIVDLHACETLAELARELAGEGARLRLVEPRSSVRDSLRLAGLEELVGSINRFTTVAEAVEEFHQAPGAQQEPGSKPAAQEPAS